MQNYGSKFKIFSGLNINRIILIAGIAAGALLIAFLFWWQGWTKVIGVTNEPKTENKPVASLTGLVCENYANFVF